MGYSCQFCQRLLSPSYNRDRREQRGRSNLLEEKQGNTTSEHSMDKNPPDVFDDVQSEERDMDLDLKEDDEYDDDEEDTGDQDESEGECSTDTENNGRPWKRLRLEVVDDLSSKYDKKLNSLETSVLRKN